jgi:hypothetical protein
MQVTSRSFQRRSQSFRQRGAAACEPVKQRVQRDFKYRRRFAVGKSLQDDEQQRLAPFEGQASDRPFESRALAKAAAFTVLFVEAPEANVTAKRAYEQAQKAASRTECARSLAIMES